MRVTIPVVDASFEQARTFLDRAISAYGKDDPRVVPFLDDLADVLTDITRARYDLALPLLREASRIRGLPGGEAVASARAASRVAAALVRLGQLDEAEGLLRSALVVQQGALPPDHHDLGSTLTYLAMVCDATGRAAEARSLVDRALPAYEAVQRVSGGELPLTYRPDYDGLIGSWTLATTMERFDESPARIAQLEGAAPSGCFVATAVYGRREHPAVVALRRFRDEVMVASPPGRLGIVAYGALGPWLGRLARRWPSVRVLARRALTPLARRLRRHGRDHDATRHTDLD